MNGRKEKSPYFNDEHNYYYWLGFIQNEPYCLIMTSQIMPDVDIPLIWKENLSKAGNAYTLDFLIGNEKYLGKGLGAITLRQFTEFFKQNIDEKANTFMIDPEENNSKAKHVYKKAGFISVGKYEMKEGYFEGHNNYLMVKKMVGL